MGDEYKGALPTISDSTAGDPPLQTRRKYDLSDMFIKRSRSAAPLFSILSHRMQKRPTSDPEFKHLEDGETAYKGTLYGGVAGTISTLATNGTAIYITNLENILQPGDIIHVPSNQTNNTQLTTSRLSGENMTIVSVSGNTAVVTRNSAGTYNVASATTATNGLAWTLIGSASREGATSRDALQDIMGIGQNYCQIFRESIEVTGSMDATELWGPDELQRQREKKLQHVARMIERAFIHGVKAREFENNKPKRTTGGILYWLEYLSTLSDPDGEVADYAAAADLVSGNHTSRIHKMGAALTEKAFFRFLEWAFAYGNTEKWAFCGPTFITELQQVFTGKVQLSPLAKEYGLNILDLMTPHGNLHILHEPEFMSIGTVTSQPAGYGADCLILDVPFLEYRYTVAKSGNSKYTGPRDLRLIQGIQANDADTVKEEAFAEVGIGLKFAKSHSWLTRAQYVS